VAHGGVGSPTLPRARATTQTHVQMPLTLAHVHETIHILIFNLTRTFTSTVTVTFKFMFTRTHRDIIVIDSHAVDDGSVRSHVHILHESTLRHFPLFDIVRRSRGTETMSRKKPQPQNRQSLCVCLQKHASHAIKTMIQKFTEIDAVTEQQQNNHQDLFVCVQNYASNACTKVYTNLANVHVIAFALCVY